MFKNKWLVIPLLISLVIVPRLSIDFLLPALPHIGELLQVDDTLLRMTITMYMFGYALSMLIAGPLSDLIGRKQVLIYGLTLFILASFICAIAPSIHVLIAARFFQALGGCCGTVIARVMVKDVYSREEQIEILAHLSAAMSVCPLIIPILGGILQTYFTWRLSFYILAFFALGLLLLSKREINAPIIARTPFSWRKLVGYYTQLLTHRLFLGYSLTIGFAWFNYFAFTIESPFLIQKTLGFSSIGFGVLFAFTVLGYLIGTQMTKRLANQIGWDELIFIAILFCLIGSFLNFGLIWYFDLTAITLILPMAITMMGIGIIIPCTQAAVMQPFPHIAGTASGLFFFIQMSFGVICGLILQTLSHESALPVMMTMCISSVLLLVSFYFLIWSTRTNTLAYEKV